MRIIAQSMGKHKNRFDLSESMNNKKNTLKIESKSSIKRKKIPSGSIINNIKRGEYSSKLKVGDWAIIDDANMVRYFWEIIKVNPRTLIVEKESISSDGKLQRYYSQIKYISGAISI